VDRSCGLTGTGAPAVRWSPPQGGRGHYAVQPLAPTSQTRKAGRPHRAQHSLRLRCVEAFQHRPCTLPAADRLFAWAVAGGGNRRLGTDALGRTIVCVVGKNYSSSGIPQERTLMYLIHQLDSVVNKVSLPALPAPSAPPDAAVYSPDRPPFRLVEWRARTTWSSFSTRTPSPTTDRTGRLPKRSTTSCTPSAFSCAATAAVRAHARHTLTLPAGIVRPRP